jgi:hypothetical protein
MKAGIAKTKENAHTAKNGKAGLLVVADIVLSPL